MLIARKIKSVEIPDLTYNMNRPFMLKVEVYDCYETIFESHPIKIEGNSEIVMGHTKIKFYTNDGNYFKVGGDDYVRSYMWQVEGSVNPLMVRKISFPILTHDSKDSLKIKFEIEMTHGEFNGV